MSLAMAVRLAAWVVLVQHDVGGVMARVQLSVNDMKAAFLLELAAAVEAAAYDPLDALTWPTSVASERVLQQLRAEGCIINARVARRPPCPPAHPPPPAPRPPQPPLPLLRHPREHTRY